ncbi:O-antigen translocase [Pseudomonas cremoricolorata]|uniref:O-antigen translocase n=1 Tax=Pseudomonas cremoricolorata TaxID=157783 RepID=UPI0003FA5B09|nr:O-antigen translocase [Pseudomonas cremoricolorata]
MKLIRTSLLNAIAVAVKMATMLGLNKVLALHIGPAGYAAIGQLQNAIQVLTTASSGAITSGVVKYTAEYQGGREKEIVLWRTSGTMTAIACTLIAVMMAMFSVTLSQVFFASEQFSSVFLWFSGGILFFSYNALLLAILNGRKEIEWYVCANIAGSLLSFCATVLLTRLYGLAGALIALVTYQSFSFLVTALIVSTRDWFRWGFIFGQIDRTIASNLGRFALMALVSAACVPVMQIAIRHHLIQSFGSDAAGYWEAMTRLSSAYLLLVTTTLGVYYLPRLSELTSAAQIKREVREGYTIIVPALMVSCVVVFLLRDLIVKLLFTPEFLPMTSLFAGQLIGDALKICSWLIAYIMLSKAMFKMFIATEIAACLSLYALTLLLTSQYGLEGAVWAYAVNYSFYALIMYFLVYRRLDGLLAPTSAQATA